jgi:hypothetical protein
MLGGVSSAAGSLGASGIGSKLLGALPTALSTAAPVLGTLGQDAAGMTGMFVNTQANIATQLEAAKLNEQMDLTQALVSLMNKGSSNIAKAAGGQ